MITDRFGTIGLLGMALVLARPLFAQAKIAAKPVRDMGLPGWWVLLSAAVSGAAIAVSAGPTFGKL